MKTQQLPQFKTPCFGHTMITNSVKTAQNSTIKLMSVFKELANKFKETNEIGRFEKIKAEILEPLKDSTIKKAYVVVEPTANKNDFRTRVLSFISVSPVNENIKYSVCQASGNKFAIDSVLKNPSTISAFKNFIKDSEKYFG